MLIELPTHSGQSTIPQTQKLLSTIQKHKAEIHDILLAYESQETIADELFKSIDCLEGIHSVTVDQIASLLPVNLPLYSLILFGLIPSLMAKKTYVRPPRAMQKAIKDLYSLLDIEHLFPNLELLENIERDTFRTEIAEKSNVVIFTGSQRNALKIYESLPKKCLFIYNGAGINPLVVFKNASIALAVEKTVHVKIFNSGQDCAGPDTILVHETVYETFHELLVKQLKALKISSHYTDGARIGPMIETSYLPELSKLLLKDEKFITYGGSIDYGHRIVHPTIITKSLDQGSNYSEIFAPLFYISTFNETTLPSYFNNDLYRNNAMYVSVFGSSDLEKHITHSVILRDTDVIEQERGNAAYGGYGLYSSYVCHYGHKEVRPILISQEIAQAFAPTV